MKRRLWTFSAAPALACAFVLFGQGGASAQGRAGGGPVVSGQPSRVEQSMGRTIDVSAGRGSSDPHVMGPPIPSLENPRQYEYAAQARLRANNERDADKQLRDHPDMPARLNTTADELRRGYREATFYNPTLTFGQYVAVTRLAADLVPTHPNITRTGLLNGLAARKTIEQTLRDRGLTKDEAKEAVRRVEREIKESKRRS